jgi:hypothetical protein
MVPPGTLKIYETPTSTMWLDEDGILCSIAKKAPAQSLEMARKNLDIINSITGGKKVCLLSDSTNSSAANKEMRDFAAEVIPQIAKAIAILSRSALGKMSANLFFALKKQPYPVRFFNNEKEAKEWLKQYL